jgi:DNA-directed RNA polymerase subunit RPC12/RpoP
MEARTEARKGDSENQSAGWTVCPCNNCSGNLEFDPEHVGETVACPHCAVDTVLFIPQVPADSLPSEPEVAPKYLKPKKAKKVELAHEQRSTPYRGGLEESLENTGGGFAAFGFFLLLVALLLFLAGEGTWASVCFLSAVVVFVQGAMIYTLCKAGAEIIRLLKKSNGLKFSGKISQPTGLLDDALFYVCSACGASVHPAQMRCTGCGAEFEPGLTKGKESNER